jgi:protoporphyrinogen oxidase
MSGKPNDAPIKIVIVGAGPAGLTAAYELNKHSNFEITILESTDSIGGISRTVNYKGNRIDIGGHRFFSKSKRVMDWWLNIFPVQGKPGPDDVILQKLNPDVDLAKPYIVSGPDPSETDNVMLIRRRVSRIFFLKRFFDYPVSLNANTLRNLGLVRIFKIFFSYIGVKLSPIKKENSLEDFFINRFGKELYKTFFKDYTEKVWGISCDKIKPEWGAQRIKGLSITKAIFHAISVIFSRDHSIHQKKTETSLIEQFLYPKFGPGQMWEKVAEDLVSHGVNLLTSHTVKEIGLTGIKVNEIKAADKNGNPVSFPADHVISTMAVKDLIHAIGKDVPKTISEIAEGLMYRDFITVGLLLEKLNIQNNTKLKMPDNLIPDNWIYMQERNMKVGRLQIFNNWSPFMVKDPEKVWIGMEYFCNDTDDFWNNKDEDIIRFAIDELAESGIILKEDVLDHTVIRMPKTYPAYFGSYERFDEIRKWTDQIENLWLIGRNGMHRYNNQDHSMLTAMVACENILSGNPDKENIWAVNTEEEYHEENT